MANDLRSDRQRASIEKRTLALADQYVHEETKTLALTNSMDFYTLANLTRNLDDVKQELQKLSLYRMDLDNNYAHEIVPILSRFVDVLLDDCEGTHVHAIIFAILKQARIRRLHMFSQVQDPEVDSAFRKGLRISELRDLSLTIEINLETAESLCEGINSSHVTCWNMNQCEIYVDAFDTLCSGLRNNTCLETLKLDHCGLQDEEVANLAQAVKHHPKLKELSVRLNYAAEDSVDSIADLLQSTSQLEYLDMAQQNPGILDLSCLAQALVGNETLVHLNLQENFLKDIHIPVLVQSLSVNTTMRELNLENCELKNTGLLRLIEGLGDFRSLTHLWLKENRFTEPFDPVTLQNSLQRNNVLQVLELDNEDWIPPSLRYHLLLNRAGRKFLEPGSISLCLWPTLLARVKSLFAEGDTLNGFSERDVQYDLLHGPALLER